MHQNDHGDYETDHVLGSHSTHGRLDLYNIEMLSWDKNIPWAVPYFWNGMQSAEEAACCLSSADTSRTLVKLTVIPWEKLTSEKKSRIETYSTSS